MKLATSFQTVGHWRGPKPSVEVVRDHFLKTTGLCHKPQYCSTTGMCSTRRTRLLHHCLPWQRSTKHKALNYLWSRREVNLVAISFILFFWNKDTSKHKRTFQKAAEHLITKDRKSCLYNSGNS